MKFTTPATENPIDQLKVVGKPVDRIDGPLKTTGQAPYAFERHDVAANQAYGWILGAAIAKGRIVSMDLARAQKAPGVLTIITAENAGKLSKAERNTAPLLGGPEIQHYHQAIAVVVAGSLEQARAAAALIKVEYAAEPGRHDLHAAKDSAKPAGPLMGGSPSETKVGDFDSAFAAAPVKLDATYSTANESHSMMEPHATIAAWQGDKLTVWTSNQMIAWAVADLAETLGIPKENIRVNSPFIGGGFGGKLFLRADVLLAALAARAAKRPVKIALQRALIPNNTTHRAATIQRIRIGAGKDGKITAIAHESWSGDLPKGAPETAALQTRQLYAGDHRLTSIRLAELDLSEANAMRAPGEAPGLAALEIAMDEMAEKLAMDPIDFRLLNDTQTVPDNPPPPPKKDESQDKEQSAEKKDGNEKEKAKAEEQNGKEKEKEKEEAPDEKPKQEASKPPTPFSQRQLAECFRVGKERFGWSKRQPTGSQARQGRWLIGLGTAAAFRNNLAMKSAARVTLDRTGRVTVETDMTDIGTGSYTIIAQTAAEMLGLPLDQITVRLGDSSFPVSCGSGGQWGGNNSTAGVYAACTKLRELIAQKAGFDATAAAAPTFADGKISSGGKSTPLAGLADESGLTAEDHIEYGDLDKKFQQSTFGAHFAEVAVDSLTGETRVRRQLAVCAAGRILNPKTARSQVIGAMIMGMGTALMEELAVDKKRGFFANHDLAGYEIPAHADAPLQEVIFLDETDPVSSPMKAKGVGELGICGAAAAIANAIHNATGIRVRDYPITLDKLLDQLPDVA